MSRASAVASAGVAIFAFAIFRATMLPGVELGDSASFQVMTGSAVITPRDAYPLYFAIARVLFWASAGEPAHVLNLASVLEGAAACGLVVLVAAELSGSLAAASATAVLFAGSYTFWSQSVIAEVYALHVLLLALTLLLVLKWANEPTLGRLTLFFAAYAVSFGNHLAMILMAPAYTLFLLAAASRGWRSILTARVVALAIALAMLGAAQYLWNLHSLWRTPTPPHDLAEALRKFWFDVTKVDWRHEMIFTVPTEMAGERLRMYAFDLHQQFGWPGVGLALAGGVALARRSGARAALVVLAYVVNVLFALVYKVGDSHVFFLPSHLMLALLIAPGIALIGDLAASRKAVVALVLALALARVYRDYPALDRSEDHRPAQALSALTSGLDDRREILLTDLNWQLENGLTYFAKHDNTNVAHALLADVLPYAPTLIRDNREVGREVVLTERARSNFEAAYGLTFPSATDQRAQVFGLDDLTRALPRGTRYVLCVLTPSPEFAIDARALEDALRTLSGNRVASLGQDAYTAIAGLVGEEPVLIKTSSTPFRDVVMLGRVRVDVRMESWLTFDTIRRMGFGQVVAAHRHALIVERGVSLVAVDAAGRVISMGYDANVFAPRRRYLIR